MTPARAELESIVGALRRKQLLAVTVAALVEMMLAAAILFAVLRVGLPNLILSPSRRLVLAIGLALVFVAAMLLEQARQARSFFYLAKRIDVENDLGDHLVSALAFADPSESPFERACVNALILRLRQQSLRIPEVHLQRVWLLAPAILIALGTAAIEYRRRHRPTDDGELQVTLPASLREQLGKVTEVATELNGKVDPELAKLGAAAQEALTRHIEHAASKQDVIGAISQVRDGLASIEQNNPSMIDAALQLGNPATQRTSQLVSAMRSGSGSEVDKALKTLIGALEGKQPPPLSPEEREELSAVFRELSKVTRNAALGKQLEGVSDAVRNEAMGPNAAKPLEAVRPALVEQFDREAAAKKLARSIRAALNTAGRDAEIQVMKLQPPGIAQTTSDGGSSGATTLAQREPGDPSDEATATDPDPTGTGGKGAGSAVAGDNGGGTPEQPNANTDVRVSAPWVGASATQLVTASAGTNEDAKKAVRQILGTQQRALERDVRREEIPAEYAQAIRRYFFNVQRDLEKK